MLNVAARTLDLYRAHLEGGLRLWRGQLEHFARMCDLSARSTAAAHASSDERPLRPASRATEGDATEVLLRYWRDMYRAACLYDVLAGLRSRSTELSVQRGDGTAADRTPLQPLTEIWNDKSQNNDLAIVHE